MMMTVLNARIGSVEMGMSMKPRKSAMIERMATILMNALIPAKKLAAEMAINGKDKKIVMMGTMTMMITASGTVKWRLVGTSSSTR